MRARHSHNDNGFFLNVGKGGKVHFSIRFGLREVVIVWALLEMSALCRFAVRELNTGPFFISQIVAGIVVILVLLRLFRHTQN